MLPSRSVADTTVPAVGDRLARVGMRAVLLVGLAAVLLALSGGPAEAHAALVAADPAAGQRLATAPGLVVLRFTEPLNTRLSGATVTAPDGRRFQGAAFGADELRMRLLANAPGVYRVAWATASVVDGHALRGGFRLGVGVAVGGPAGGSADGSAGTGPRLSDVLIAAGRAVEDAALLAAVGMLLLVGLARRDPPLAQVRPRVVVVLAVALGAGLVVVTAEAAVASAATGLSVGGVAAYLTSRLPGWARLARVALEGVALVWCLPSSRSGRFGLGGPGAWPAVAVAGAVVALAASGHAAGATPGWWGITVDAAHLLAAGLWAGGILALAAVRLRQGRQGRGHGWRGSEGAAVLGGLVARFAPVALVAFVVSAGFGVVQAFQQVGTVQALLGSAYGQTLGVKVGRASCRERV